MKKCYLKNWLLLMVVCVFVLSGNAARAEDAVAMVTIGQRIMEFADFSEAIEVWIGAEEPATLTLLGNYTRDNDTIHVSGSSCKTLELNGHTLTYDAMAKPVVQHECELIIVGPGTIRGANAVGIGSDLTIIGDVTMECDESVLLFQRSKAGYANLAAAVITEWKIANVTGKKMDVSARLALPNGYKIYRNEEEIEELRNGQTAAIKRDVNIQKSVALVNETSYSTISEALAAWAESGGTLTLLDNAACENVNITLQAGKEYTFQGGDYTLDLGNQPLGVNGTLNIVSGAISGLLACNGGSINVESDAGAGLAVKNADPQGSAADIKLPDGYCLMTAPENGQYVEQL